MNLQSLKNRESGKPCVIVCTGPELNKTPPELINRDKYVTISMNNIWLMKDRFIPDYWLAEDNIVIEYNSQQIVDYQGPIKLLPSKYYHPDFIPFEIPWGDERCLFSTDLTQFIGWGGTVTYPAFQLAWWLGCREVYLIGSGPGWNGLENAKEDKIPTNTEADSTHFSPDYYKAQPVQHRPAVAMMRKCFTITRDFYDANGGKIYDCTPIPIFDIFEQGEWEWLIE